MQFYSPSGNRWSAIENPVRPDVYDWEWLENSMFLARGNSLFILHVVKPIFGEEPDADDRDIEYRYICVNWSIPENGGLITDVDIDDFPVPMQFDRVNSFGGMLAIPP